MKQKTINYLSLAKLLVSRWYWISFALLIGFFGAYTYITCTPPLYATTALLKFEDKKSEISELMNIRNLYDRTNKVESEKSVLRSRTVIQKAIKAIDYEISYYENTNFKKINLYPYKPFIVKILNRKNHFDYGDFEFTPLGYDRFKLCFTYQNKSICKGYQYDQKINLPGTSFNVTRAEKPLKTGSSYIFNFNDPSLTFEKTRNALKFEEGTNTNVLMLKIVNTNPFLATDILNSILDEYLTFDTMQRSVAASQTVSFINSVIKTMADTVKNSASAIQKFKEGNPSIITTDNLNHLTNRLSDLYVEKHTSEIEEIMISTLENSVIGDLTGQTTVNQPGITDQLFSKLIVEHNQLITRKKELLNTYTEDAFLIKQLNQKINDSRKAINETIASQRKQNANKNTLLGHKIDSINLSLNGLPKTEKEFINLQARFNINQKVYNYLAEKKLEAEISRAAVIPGAIIIDRAEYPEEPLSPKPVRVYLFSVLLSLLLSIALACAFRIFNPYIYTKSTIEEYSDTPIIGIVRKYSGKTNNKNLAFTTDPRSLFSESIRSVRSNLSFFAPEKTSKIVCITSEISGEGKSFISTNLALSLTLTEMKVLLIAADLRKSGLHKDFSLGNSDGLSKFLSGQVGTDDIINSTNIKNLDLIVSGPIPPNPSELLLSPRMQLLLDSVKERYDFIIIDSAPIGLVTDGKPLLKMADITLFIVRYGISKRFFANTPDQLQSELGLSHVAIVLNDYVDSNFHSYNYPSKQPNTHKKTYYHSDRHNHNYPDYFEL